MIIEGEAIQPMKLKQIEKVFLDIFVISKKTVKEHPAFPLVENNQQQLILTH